MELKYQHITTEGIENLAKQFMITAAKEYVAGKTQDDVKELKRQWMICSMIRTKS